MVAGRGRLGDPRLPIGEQPGQEHARFDLGARDRHPVSDPPKRGAPDIERRQPSLAALHRGAHLAKRLGHSIDRAAADRLVAVEHPLSPFLPRKPAGQESHQGSGISRVDHLGALVLVQPGPPQPDSLDPQVDRARPVARGRLRAGPELLHRLAGGLCVGRVQIAGDLDGPLAHRRDERGAVADGLVGRRPELPSQRPRGIEARHVEIETEWPSSRTISAARPASASPATHSETAPVRMSGAG